MEQSRSNDMPEGQSLKEAVRRFTQSRVLRLQGGRDRSATVAALARLRRAVDAVPGSVPEVWDLTMDGVPGSGHGDDAPTPSEWAVHTALCLYAIRQQGHPEPAHENGVGLGRAVGRLDRALGPESTEGDLSPTRRRFAALSTAATPEEMTYHLRGLVTQMKTKTDSTRNGVQLDFGQLAADLLDWRQGRAHQVRLHWARDFYRTDRIDKPTENAPEEDQ